MLKLMKKHKIEASLVILSVVLLIIYTLRFATIFDEDYSLLLSHNSFSNIIKLDSVDVHPPLYYFLLKVFVTVTTFWTKSFLIKIISARILSVIISIISFMFLTKLCKEVDLKNNVLIQWLLFLLVPGVISFTYQFIKIRMYSLGALFVVIQLYELIKYDKTNNNKFLILSTLMVIGSLYTNYYTALISGIFLFIYIIYKAVNHQRCLQLFISGIISLIIFLPWSPILLKQLSLQNNHPIGGFNKQAIVVLVFLIMFGYPLLWTYKHYKDTYLFKVYLSTFVTSSTLFLIMSIASIVFKPVFTFRYFYPTLLIYCFLGLNIYVKMYEQSYNYINRNSSIVVLLFSTIICLGGYVSQVTYYGLSSIQLVNNLSKWKNEKNKTVHLQSINNPDKGFDIEKSMYLTDFHKRIVVPDTRTNKPTDIEMTYKNPAYTKLFYKMNKHILN